MKHKQRKLVRIFTSLLASWFLALHLLTGPLTPVDPVPVAKAAPEVVGNPNDPNDSGHDGGSAADQQKAFLKTLRTVDQVRDEFDIKDKDASIDMDYRYSDGKNGFNPRSNADPGIKKFAGNPWFEWTNPHGKGNKSVGGIPVRFVLSAVQIRKEGGGIEQTVTGQEEGVAWIFQNEYNPRLSIIFWRRNGSGGLNGGNDYDRMVLTGACDDVTSTNDKVLITKNVNHADSDPKTEDFPEDPGDKDKLDKKIEKYHLEGSQCTVDKGIFGGIMGKVIKLIGDALSYFLKTVTGWVDGIIDIGTLGNNPGLTSAWKTIRDFVNIIFILILVAIAFSNILRIDTERYGVRALLPRLIFAVIAVNFSFLLVQILVNVAYIISQPFLDSARQLLTDPPANGSLIDADAGFGKFLVGSLVLLATIFALLILLFFFIVRILMIWLLTALSPFVFLFMVLPTTRKLASQWWSNALKWIFMAPISIIILFVASELISGGGDLASRDNADTSDPMFILKIGFFAGAAIAAVIIPLKLGGEVMGRAARGAMGGGKLGGKGFGKLGMAAADNKLTKKIPGGGDRTLGTRMRGGKAALEARKELKQASAQEYLAEQVAAGSGIGRLAGASAGQQNVARQKAVADKQKQMTNIGSGGKLRIAHAHGKDLEAGDMVYNSDGQELGALTGEEADLAKSQIASEAAFGELAQAGAADQGLHEKFADSGLQSLNPHNPTLAALERDGKTVNQGRVNAAIGHASFEDANNWEDEFFDHAITGAKKVKSGVDVESLPAHEKAAYKGMQQLDSSRAGLMATEGQRESLKRKGARDRLHVFADIGGFEDNSKNTAVQNSAKQVRANEAAGGGKRGGGDNGNGGGRPRGGGGPNLPLGGSNSSSTS